ncbi:hypothetical protein CsSME_00005868 [Camellia sinensis var. sinensis]
MMLLLQFAVIGLQLRVSLFQMSQTLLLLQITCQMENLTSHVMALSRSVYHMIRLVKEARKMGQVGWHT